MLSSINKIRGFWFDARRFLIGTMSGLLFSLGMQIFVIHCVMVVSFDVRTHFYICVKLVCVLFQLGCIIFLELVLINFLVGFCRWC